MYDTAAGVRCGFHAHKTLNQLLVCVHGSRKILMDDGREKQDVILDKPDEGLLVPAHIWHEMYDFAPGTVLMVLASDVYDESDYIRNYDDFLSYVGAYKK